MVTIQIYSENERYSMLVFWDKDDDGNDVFTGHQIFTPGGVRDNSNWIIDELLPYIVYDVDMTEPEDIGDKDELLEVLETALAYGLIEDEELFAP